MVANFGVPPEGERARSLVEERLRLALEEDGAKVTVDWRGEQRHLHVISMPTDVLYFNPDTHRIRAQRSLDPDQNAVLDTEPWSEDAQRYLHHLLTRKPSDPAQEDPDFIALRNEIDDFGQKEPGIITRDGILVDGNTRCAAMRELGIENIRVGVLPADASRADINNVELALQLRRDKRRDYSYINRLIAIEEQIRNGRREDDVARDFNIRVKTLRQDRWVYELISEAIERSSANGAKLRLVDFEDHQEKLRELQRDYANLAAKDPEGAELLKETRLAMVVLNYSKTSVRLAEKDFHGRYLEKRLEGELKPEYKELAAPTIPGLPGVSAPRTNANVAAAKELADTLLKAKATSQVEDDSKSGEAKKAGVLLRNARTTFDTAVKLAGQNAELQKRRIVVQDRLTDAVELVNQCSSEFAEAKAKRALDEEAFDDALTSLKESLERLARQARRAFQDPGVGTSWLIQAAECE